MATSEAASSVQMVSAFVWLLRQAGVVITSGQANAAVRALDVVDVRRREEVYAALRATLLSRHEDDALFARAFLLFWNGEPGGSVPPAPWTPPWMPPPDRRGDAASGHAARTLRSDAPTVEARERMGTWSAAERLRHADYAVLDAAERAVVEAALITAQRPARRPDLRQTRRWRAQKAGQTPDLRRTLQQMARHAGEPVHLLHRARRRRARPLVLICDVSGSMERYARLMVLAGLVLARRRDAGRRAPVEVFAVGTRLTRLTPFLVAGRLDAALRLARSRVEDWGGGTRLGEGLALFRRQWAARLLRHGATLVIASDGCDRGDPALLGAELARLSWSARRLLWVNPLVGDPRYRPETRAMVAALPSITRMVAGHSLASVEAWMAALTGSHHI